MKRRSGRQIAIEIFGLTEEREIVSMMRRVRLDAEKGRVPFMMVGDERFYDIDSDYFKSKQAAGIQTRRGRKRTFQSVSHDRPARWLEEVR